jgi:TolB-like protein/Tfp pilus assembly protein PilF
MIYIDFSECFVYRNQSYIRLYPQLQLRWFQTVFLCPPLLLAREAPDISRCRNVTPAELRAAEYGCSTVRRVRLHAADPCFERLPPTLTTGLTLMYPYDSGPSSLLCRRWLKSGLCALMGLFLLLSAAAGGTVFADPTAAPSGKEKKRLVEHGVAQYTQKDLDGAKKTLEQAQAVFPENFAVPFYLGLIYLQEGRREDAITQWRRYLDMDPGSQNARELRKTLTLLLREEARANARAALAGEAALAGVEADSDTIAVSAFSNIGSIHLGPLGKGLAAMLVTDLAKVPGLQVVDRMALQALLEELKLGTSGLVDRATAPQVGRLLKVRRVATGSLSDVEATQLQIASVLFDAERNADIGGQDVEGDLDSFFVLQKQIACGIITAMGKNCESAPGAFHKPHTTSWPAFVSFSKGLDQFDNNQYDEARASFQEAVQQDPDFELARQALDTTPTSAMLLWNTSQIVSNTGALGVTPSAAGSATISAGGLGTTTLLVAGGVVVGAGAIALAAGGGSSSDPPPAPHRRMDP